MSGSRLRAKATVGIHEIPPERYPAKGVGSGQAEYA
jgi:hypothetical protein